MYYIQTESFYELEISKSRFIALLMPIKDKDAIKLVIESLKIRFPKANHYTYASIIGEKAEIQVASDDGEPQKTAGVPILDVLKHKKLTDVVCVVIRYFGGIKLGAGGLIRAYAKSASNAISNAILYDKKSFETYEITFRYHLIDKIDQFLDKKASVIDKTFMEDVTYQISFDQSDASSLEDIKHLLNHVKKLSPKIHYVPILKSLNDIS
jgi:uncharacterized YigZ family protein